MSGNLETQPSSTLVEHHPVESPAQLLAQEKTIYQREQPSVPVEQLCLSEASDKEKFLAVQDMLHHFLARVNDLHPKDVMSVYRYVKKIEMLLAQSYSLSESNKSQFLIKLQHLVISLYDLFVGDLIHKYSSDNKTNYSSYLFSEYFRDKEGKPTGYTKATLVDPRIQYFTTAELKELIASSFSNKEKYQQFSTVQEFLNLNVREYKQRLPSFIIEPLTTETILFVTEKIEEIHLENAKANQPQYNLFGTLYLNQSVGGVYCLGAKQSDLEPLNPLPIQEMYLSLLELGIGFDIESNYTKAFFTPDFNQSEAAVELDTLIANWESLLGDLEIIVSKLEKNKIKYFNQAILDLSFKYNIDSAEILARTQSRYERMFYREHPHFGSTKVFITRSGVSANDLVERAIELLGSSTGQKSKKKACAFNWYYENLPHNKMRFEHTSLPDESTEVLFICFEPTAPTYEASEIYAQKINDCIATLKNNAKQNPEKNFVIVLDKTSNLQASLFDPSTELDLPTNLFFIETASLTKHQGGARNYFSGLITYWGSEDLWQKILSNQISARATLTDTSTLHLPRLPKSEQARGRAELAVKSRYFKECLLEGMKTLPAEAQLIIEDYNYYSFINLPYPYLFSLAEKLTAKNQMTSVDITLKSMLQEASISIDKIGIALFEGINIILLPDEIKTVEGGDSFNLNATRLVVNLVENPPVNKQWIDADTIYSLRLSWGKDTSLETIKKMAIIAAQYYVTSFNKLEALVA